MVEVAIRLAAPCQLAVPQMLSPANIPYTRALQGLPVTFCNAQGLLHAAAMGFPLARGSNLNVTNICGGVPCLDHPRYCGILTPAFQPKRGLLSQRILHFIDPKTGPLGSGSLLVLPHQLIAPVIHGKTPGLLFMNHPSFSLYLLQGAKFIGNQTQKNPCDLKGACWTSETRDSNLYLLIISSIPEDFLDFPNDGSSSWSAETWHRHFMS
jgi:hypothetical protein